jgi:hypothetical protein
MIYEESSSTSVNFLTRQRAEEVKSFKICNIKEIFHIESALEFQSALWLALLLFATFLVSPPCTTRGHGEFLDVNWMAFRYAILCVVTMLCVVACCHRNRWQVASQRASAEQFVLSDIATFIAERSYKWFMERCKCNWYLYRARRVMCWSSINNYFSK